MTPAALREKPILAWHFVAIRDGVPTLRGYDKTTDRDALAVAPGYIYTTDEPRIKCCASGLHWSREVRDALRYASRSERLAVCRVRAWGKVDEQHDKGASRHREVLWVADATDALRWWALDCARRVEGYSQDPRVAACNQASEDYLRGRITRDELLRARAATTAATTDAAAYAAADAAAYAYAAAAADAAYAAADAAYAAADAAYAAADAAAYAYAAADADDADDAERKWQSDALTRRMLALGPRGAK